MFKAIFNFFRKEKFYTLLFFATLFSLGYFWLLPHPKVRPVNSSPALEEFRRAEKNLEAKLEKAGSWQHFLKERPSLNFFFEVLSFFVAGAFCLGLLLDFFLFFRPEWRRRLGSAVAQKIPWRLSMLFKVALLFVASSILLSLVLAFARPLGPRGLSSNFYLLLHTTLADFLCLGFILYVVRQEGGHWRDLGLRIPEGNFGREVLVGWAGYLAILPFFIGVLLFLILLARLLSYEPPAHPLVNVFLEEEERSPVLIVYSIFLAGVLGPFLEEIFFRGFCYPIFKRKFGRAWGMLLSAAFFALIHENTFAFWPIFILGLGLTYLYEKRRSLIAPAVLHITHNAIFIAYFFIAKKILLHEAASPLP